MSDAPGRIWTAGHHYWSDPTFKRDKVEYIRADLCNPKAIREAVLREAALHVACHADDRPSGDSMDYNDGYMDACARASAVVLSLIDKEPKP